MRATNDAAIATIRADGMRYRRTMLLGPLLLALAEPGPTPGPAGIDLFILAGQSNMSGRGDVSELFADERRPDPRILLYANDDRLRPAEEPLDSALGQIDTVSADVKAGVGPGLFAARRLAGGASTRRIALLPCAKGGSSLVEWRPSLDPGTLYGSCLRRTRAAGASPAAILWYQGESDARSVAAATAWPAEFRDLVDRWRADLGRPHLPVVVVSLADPPPPKPDSSYPGWSAIQLAQRRLAIRCVMTVPAAGLSRNADQLHLATAGQRTLGLRIAQAVKELRRAGCN